MKKDFEPGDIISYADEEYYVVKNYGEGGHVREYFGEDNYGDEIFPFYWYYDGAECELVRRAK